VLIGDDWREMGAVEVVLAGEEREVLERWARRPKSSQALALRRLLQTN
jgi:hypothetical protein